MKKPKTKEPSLRDRLSQIFDEALLADFAANPTVIEQMRTKDPTRYAELVCKRITTAEPRPDGFESCQTMDEIGIKLLEGVGCARDIITPDMVMAAVQAHDALVERLGQIAQGN